MMTESHSYHMWDGKSKERTLFKKKEMQSKKVCKEKLF